jgi:hypothetical protein
MTPFEWWYGLVERLPQPERSGTKGAILAVAILYGMLQSFGAGGGGDPWCSMHPLLRECATEAPGRGVRWRTVEHLSFGKNHRANECACHVDWKEVATGKETHFHEEGFPCGTDVGLSQEAWTTLRDGDVQVGPYIFSSGTFLISRDGVGIDTADGYAIKLHCTDDPEYAVRTLTAPIRDDED